MRLRTTTSAEKNNNNMTCLLLLVLVFNIVQISSHFGAAFLTLDLEEEISIADTQPYKHCACVPFWQCREDFGGPDGEGISILDIRSSKTSKGPETCTGYFDVCCKVECGMRETSLPTIMANQNEFEKRILGGDNTADFGEFPWMLGILKGRAYKCGGSLIHPKVALTAAHCVWVPAKYIVRAGEWHWEHTQEPLPHQDREVESVVVHPDFHAGSLSNDIALLILKTPFKLTSNVGIVCLPPRNLKVDVRRCTASGWGKNSFKKGTYQPILKKVDLPLISREKCTTTLRRSMLGPFFTLHRSFICAGGETKKDTCKGDGGSPLICPILGQTGRYEQVGIVSWGLTCGLANTPGVYVNVVIFSDWIDAEMLKLSLDVDIYRYYHIE